MWGMGQFPPYFYWELSPPLVSFISLTSSSNNHLKIDVMIIVTLEWSIPVTSPNNKVPRLPTFWFFFNVSYFIWILSPKLPCNTCVYLKTTELDWKGWALSEQAALGQAPLHTNRSVAGRGGQSLCTQNGGAVSTRGSIATPTLVASVKEKISPGTTWSFISYRKFNFLYGITDTWFVIDQNGILTNLNAGALTENVSIGSFPETNMPSSCTTWTMRGHLVLVIWELLGIFSVSL